MNMPEIFASDLSDREVLLLRQVHALRQALQVTLDYLQSELEPEPPSNIANFRALIAEINPAKDIATDPIREFADVVKAMTRFLNNAGAMEVFERRSQSAFLEWIILTCIAGEPPGLTDRQLCRLIGASYKRTRRTVQTMAEAGLILSKPASEADSSSIEVGPAGEAMLADVNDALLPLLQRFVQRVPLQLRYLLRSLRLLARLHDRREERAPRQRMVG